MTPLHVKSLLLALGAFGLTQAVSLPADQARHVVRPVVKAQEGGSTLPPTWNEADYFIHHQEHVEITLPLDGVERTLILSLNKDLVHPDFQSVVTDYVHDFEAVERHNCYFLGHLADLPPSESSAVISTCNGITGTVTIKDGESYHIEPLEQPELINHRRRGTSGLVPRDLAARRRDLHADVLSSEHVVFRRSEFMHARSTGAPLLMVDPPSEKIVSRSQAMHEEAMKIATARAIKAREVTPYLRYVDVWLGNDLTRYNYVLSNNNNNVAMVDQDTLEILNYVQAIYAAQDFGFGGLIRLRCVGIYTDTTGALFNGNVTSTNANAILTSLTEWKRTQVSSAVVNSPAYWHDTFILFVGRWGNSIAADGVAYLGTICGKWSGGYDTSVVTGMTYGHGSRSQSLWYVARTTSHELGHTLNLYHDGDGNSCSASAAAVMATANWPNYQVPFSSCSVGQMTATMANTGYWCLWQDTNYNYASASPSTSATPLPSTTPAISPGASPSPTPRLGGDSFTSLAPSTALALRRLRASYTGAAINVRRSSDSTTRDIGFLADGSLDIATLKSFVGTGTGNHGYVTIWYDQSGNSNHATQTNETAQPFIVKDGVVQSVNTYTFRPKILFDWSRSTFFNIGSYPFSGASTASAYIVNDINISRAWARYFDFGSGTSSYFFACPFTQGETSAVRITTNGNGLEQGPYAQKIPSGDLRIFQLNHDGSTIRVSDSGTQLGSASVSVLPSAISGSLNYLGRSQWSGDAYFDGSMAEVIFFKSDVSTNAQHSDFMMSLRSYFGLYTYKLTYPQPASDALIGYYPLFTPAGPVTTDFSGRNAVATVVGTANTVSGSLSFGSSVYIRTGVTSGATRTLSAWIFPRSVTTGWVFNSDTPNYYGTALGISNGIFQVMLDNTIWTSTVSVPANAWMHVTLTISSTTAQLFVNGTLAQSFTYTQGAVESALYLIGESSASYAARFNGFIREARIYNRVLTTTEIGSVYRHDSPITADGPIIAASPLPSSTPSASVTPSASRSPSSTASPSPSATPSPSASPSPSISPSASPSPSAVPAYHRLYIKSTAKVVDINAKSTSAGAWAIQYTAGTGSNQIWRIQSNSDSTWTFVALHSGLCLDVSGATGAIQNTCSSSSTAQKFVATVNSTDSSFRLVPSSNTALCFGAANSSSLQLSLVTCSVTDDNQKFYFAPVSAAILGTQSQKYLAPASTAAGAQLLLSAVGSSISSSQIWNFTFTTAGTFLIQNRQTGLCMDSTTNALSVFIVHNTCSTSTLSQTFFLDGPVVNGTIGIRLGTDRTKALDVYYALTATGTPLDAYTYFAAPQQLFYLRYTA